MVVRIQLPGKCSTSCRTSASRRPRVIADRTGPSARCRPRHPHGRRSYRAPPRAPCRRRVPDGSRRQGRGAISVACSAEIGKGGPSNRQPRQLGEAHGKGARCRSRSTSCSRPPEGACRSSGRFRGRFRRRAFRARQLPRIPTGGRRHSMWRTWPRSCRGLARRITSRRCSGSAASTRCRSSFRSSIRRCRCWPRGRRSLRAGHPPHGVVARGDRHRRQQDRDG